jgi:hypothetical protein
LGVVRVPWNRDATKWLNLKTKIKKVYLGALMLMVTDMQGVSNEGPLPSELPCEQVGAVSTCRI